VVANLFNNVLELGFLTSFIIFGGFLALAGFINLIMLPSSLNGKPFVSNEEFEKLEEQIPVKVKFSWFFGNRRAMFALLSLTMVSYCVNFK
jgi:hypothetical protein